MDARFGLLEEGVGHLKGPVNLACVPIRMGQLVSETGLHRHPRASVEPVSGVRIATKSDLVARHNKSRSRPIQMCPANVDWANVGPANMLPELATEVNLSLAKTVLVTVTSERRDLIISACAGLKLAYWASQERAHICYTPRNGWKS
jgi:hypothetical protein